MVGATRDDPALTREAHTGPASFGTLFHRHFAAVPRIWGRSVRRSTAEDLAGETFQGELKAYHPSRQSPPPGSCRIALDLARHALGGGATGDRVHARLQDAAEDGRQREDHWATRSAGALAKRSVLARRLRFEPEPDGDALFVPGRAGLSCLDVAATRGFPFGTVPAEPAPAAVRGKLGDGGRRRPRSRRAGLMTAGALALSTAIAACGGPSKPGTATGSNTASTSPARLGDGQATGLAAYTACMRTHGVPKFSPHPTTSVGTPEQDRQQEQRSLQQLKVSKSRLLAAQKACEHLLPAGPAPSGLAAPTADPFYRWNRPLTKEKPGTILRTRTIRFPGAAATTPVRAAQLLYVTTDELGRRTVSVATVLQPLVKTAAAAIGLVSYQAAYDALGAQCDPSYTLRVGTSAAPIMPYLAAGDTVVTADYEGEDLAEGAGQQYGYETLDAIRAAETWLAVPEASTPVGMVGYSGGSIATEFASELAPGYAPHLDIVGVAEGGLPVDPLHTLAYVDHPGSAWTWVIPVHLEGAARAFHLPDFNQYLTPAGSAAMRANQARCVGHFRGLTTAQLLRPRYQHLEKVAVFARIFDRLIMSRTGTPRAPLFIGNGLSDSIGDGVVVTKDVQELAYTYCQRGVAVELQIYYGLDHQRASLPFLEQAKAFLTQRFAHLPLQNGCADIGPGNSIAPVPVPEP